jgi:hypothetical protein
MKIYILLIFLFISCFSLFSENKYLDINKYLNKIDNQYWPINLEDKTIDFKIIKIGKINNISIYETTLIWGEAKRATIRLVFFENNKKYLGQFSHYNSSKIKINGLKIMFIDSNEDLGNVIDLTNGIPKEVRIDGQILKFYFN